MTAICLKNILLKYSLDSSLIKEPTISNGGYSLDFYSPKDFYLIPNAFIELPSEFGLNIPVGYIGLMTSKAKNTIKLSVGPGQIVYPQDTKELVINLTYIGRTQEKVYKGDPLFQITLLKTEMFCYD